MADFTSLSPSEIPRPPLARDGGVRASPAYVRDPRGAALNSFSRDMGVVAGVFADLQKKRQGAEDNMFLDSYNLEYTKRASQIEAESLNSAEISDPKFVDLLDKKLEDAQKSTLDDVLTKGGFTPSDEGRTKAGEIAMGLRTSTARSATGKAHNQRVESLLLSADDNINEIARSAAANGDLEGGLKRIDSVITSVSGVVAPEKARVLRESYRKTLLESVVEGHIARGEYDKAQAIVDAETGFFQQADDLPKLEYPAGSGLIEKGNIDLNTRPVVDAPFEEFGPGYLRNRTRMPGSGQFATLRSISRNVDGVEVLIPTVTDDGKIVSDDVAFEIYKQTGKHLGKFENAEAATAYAKQLSEGQGQRYAKGTVEHAIFTAAKEQGVDPLVALGIARIESGLDPKADNPYSTAAGLFQFTAGTARDFDLPADASSASVADQAKAGARLMAANAAALERSLGGKPSPAEIYLAHFLGAGDAIRVLKADPDTALSNILTNEVLTANPFLKTMTADGVFDWAAKKMQDGMNSAGSSVGGRKIPANAATIPISDAITLSKRVASARREQKVDLDSLIKDDVASIRASGKPIGIDENVAQSVLTPNELEEWQSDKEDARAFFDATNDMSLLAEDEILGRVEAMEPRAGEVGFARSEKVHKDVQTEAKRITDLRNKDPALAVADTPAVAEAAGAFDPAKPKESWEALLKAREAAQKSIGIPDDLRTVLTEEEARRYAAGIKGMTDKDFADRLDQLGNTFMETFGDYSDEALTQVINEFVKDKDHAVYAARVVQSLIKRNAVPVSDAKALDDASENADIDAVTKSLSEEDEELKALRRDPAFLAGQRSAIEAARTGAMPNLAPPLADQNAIQYLRKHPETLNDFIDVFGETQVPTDLKKPRGR